MSLSSFILLFVVSVITWRLSNMIINDYGIFHIFLKFRFIIGIKYEKDFVVYHNYDEFKPLIYDNEDNNLNTIKTTHIGELFSCIYCLSVWLSPIFVILFIGFDQQFILNSLFVMGMTILLEESMQNV